MFILEILQTIWQGIGALFPFVVLLGILVFIHELGHFLVARWCGVRVEVFSLGFGKKLVQRKKGDTIYCISLFPLGGYVKMFGHEYGKEVPENLRSVAFLHKKIWQRTAIVLAGPLMNFFLAILIFAGLNMAIGVRQASPVVGELQADSLPSQEGLSYGDRILSVDGIKIETLENFNQLVAQKPIGDLKIEVEKALGQIKTYEISTTKGDVRGKWGFIEKGSRIEGLSFYASEPVIGIADFQSPAALAGFKTFDKIISVNGELVKSWKSLELLLEITILSSEEQLNFQVQREGQKDTLNITLNHQSKKELGIKQFGFIRSDLFIGGVKEGSAADRAGIKKEDLLLKVQGVLIPNWSFLVKQIKGFNIKDGSLKLDIKREGQVQTISLVPEIRTQMQGGVEKKHYMLGILAKAPQVLVGETYYERNLNPLKALSIGVNKTFYWCGVVGVFIKKLVVGEVSSKNLGGAIAIGRAAYDSYSYGLDYFFRIMAILSVQLFLLNLLPIPIFDGGHLLFYLIEFVKGSPLSLKKIMLAHQVGAVFLLIILIFTTFNDIHNWLFSW